MSGNYRVKDHYSRRAKEQGYRSRAAYKLEELDSKCRLLKPGMTVVDLGAFPGGWLQVAARKVGNKGEVIGVDLSRVLPFKQDEVCGRGSDCAQVHILVGDITSEHLSSCLVDQVGGRADVVLSDMSPKLSGIRDRDVAKSVRLVESTFSLAEVLLRPRGVVVAKIFPGAESDELFNQLRESYTNIRRIYLKSSKKTSKELYFVARTNL